MKQALALLFLLAAVPAHALVIGPNKGVFGVASSGGGGGGGGCGSSEFANDTFTEAGTGNIDLDTHTKDSGGTWTNGAGQNGVNSLSLDRANDVFLSTASGTNGAGAVISDTVSCQNYTVEASVRTVSTGTNRIGVTARHDLAAGTGYWLRIAGNGDISLFTMVNGAATTELCDNTVATLVGSFSTGTNYDLGLSVNGTTISAEINGISLCSITDSTYSTGKPGLLITNTGPRGDNFTATYIP